jgi:hypothetical protein
MKPKPHRFQRNDLVSVEQDIGRSPAIVLGYDENKVVVQGVFNEIRQTVAESRVRAIQEEN